MEEWSDWVVDNDPVEMIRQMRGVLSDRQRPQEDKIEALTLLTNLADEQAVALLRWYHANPDPGMEMISMLALIEAQRLSRAPRFEPWHETLLATIHQVGKELSAFGELPPRELFRSTLAGALRLERWHVSENGHALLKYDGHLIDMAALDLVVEERTLIGLWDQTDEEASWSASESDGEREENIDPLDRFYATLRSANLPWGILVDISGDEVFTNMIENLEVDRGIPRVEYILVLRN